MSSQRGLAHTSILNVNSLAMTTAGPEGSRECPWVHAKLARVHRSLFFVQNDLSIQYQCRGDGTAVPVSGWLGRAGMQGFQSVAHPEPVLQIAGGRKESSLALNGLVENALNS